MAQNHAICVVFGAVTPGNHVDTDGFELSRPRCLRDFLEKRDIFQHFAHHAPKNVDIYAVFVTLRHVFSRSKFVKALYYSVLRLGANRKQLRSFQIFLSGRCD